MKRILTLAAALLFSALLTPTARAADVEFPELHCKFTVPAEMDPMPQSEVDTITRRVNNPQVTYSHGFRRRGTDTPYILVQSITRPFFGKPESHLEELRRTIPGGDATWDAKRNAFIMELNVGNLHGTSYGFVGSGKIVFLHCYTIQGDQQNRYRPTFAQMADSFAFSPGYTMNDSRGFLLPVIIGLVILGAIAIVVIILVTRKRPKPPVPLITPL